MPLTEDRQRHMARRDGRVVCIVDDDASLRRSLRNLLTSVGFPVETFPSADAFLESDHRQDTGCMVLDRRMATRHWAAGGFSLADCAAAPALLYAD